MGRPRKDKLLQTLVRFSVPANVDGVDTKVEITMGLGNITFTVPLPDDQVVVIISRNILINRLIKAYRKAEQLRKELGFFVV